MNEPIAIVGIGCRFPGGVENPQSFWKLLVDGVDAISDMPEGRFDPDAYYDPQPAKPGKIATRQGGFLKDIDKFDPYFFGISPREAVYMDPQQRLLLEVAWEALEDGGQAPRELAGSNTGVFVGVWTGDYEAGAFRETEDINLYVTTGSGRYAASGRLSYTFDFRGPSMTLDTACSSSLVAVHLACRSIWQGEADMALAAAVNLIIEPSITIGYSRSRMLSPDGRCKFGDASANGYVRSEGAGALILKPLSAALEDGDPIYALIRGSAINNDGQSSGSLVAPGQDTQIAVFEEAYRVAGVSPAQLGYIEAHGTGTTVGDAIELNSIGSVLRKYGVQRCPVGSIKTNIGHTEAASGMAGLIKAALSLKHRQIPPNLHLKTPTPKVSWDSLPIDIPQALELWPADNSPAFAGVNSFGVTGTNAHIVLEEMVWPEGEQTADEVDERAFLFPLSAHTAASLQQRMRNLATYLLTEVGQQQSPVDLAYTLALRRAHHPHRLALSAGSLRELRAQLDELSLEDSPPFASGAEWTGKVAFVFPGQGSQWLGMGRELAKREPVFRDALAACEAAMQPFVDWSLTAQLHMDAADEAYRLDEIDVIQPTLLAIEIALAELWRSWSILPDAVVGHSMGEVGAAYIAGAMSLQDAMRVICHRSQLMRRTSGQGAMAVVELTATEAEGIVQGYEGRLAVAVYNSPRSVVISGDPDALDELLARLEAEGVYCRKVKVDVASHSAQMEPLQPELHDLLQNVQPRSGTVPIYSTSKGEVTDGADMDTAFWVENLRRPVRFAQMVTKLLEDGFTHFIEMSPHPILLPAVQQVCQHLDREALTVASMRRQEPEQATMLSGMGQLYMSGVDVDWARLYSQGRVVSLPLYPWQREHFWFQPAASQRRQSRLSHPFLDTYVKAFSGDHIWEAKIGLEQFPYLADHRVGDAPVFPAAAYIDMVLAAAGMAFTDKQPTLEGVAFHEALTFPKEGERIIQIVISPDVPTMATFEFFSRLTEEEPWIKHANGVVRLGAAAPQEAALPALDGEAKPGAEHYRLAAERGLPYGPAFQGLQRYWFVDEGAFGELIVPDVAAAAAHAHILPPPLLDGAIQLLLTTVPADDTNTYLPVSMAQIWSRGRFDPQAQYRAYAVRRNTFHDLQGDVYLFAGEELVLFIAGLCMSPLPQQKADVADWMYRVEWQRQELEKSVAAQPDAAGRWLILADRQGLGERVARRLRERGGSCDLLWADSPQTHGTKVPEWFSTRENGATFRGIIHLWSLDRSDETGEQDALALFELVKTVGNGRFESPEWLWLVTPPVAGEGAVPAAAPLWGMGRVVEHELPGVNCKRIALTAPDEEALWSELWAGDGENEVLLAEGQRLVSRLKRFTPPAAERSAAAPAAGEPYRIATSEAGTFDGLQPTRLGRAAPGEGEVEIEVHATGLNFMNVLSALGSLPGYDDGVGPLGIECAGIVSAVGGGVERFGVGDEVMGVAFESLGSHAVTDARLLVHKPQNLSFAEAAGAPIVFLTAYYALLRLGHMRAGERVLVHAGSGGVGQAAIQLAKRAGAEVFATAGTPEKRELVRGLGAEHVMDSRSLSFASETLALTNGEGVDLVLNSLAGEAVIKGLEILRPYGRFLEIGKRDIYDNSRIGLLPFQKNLSYFAIDLDRMARERPDDVGEMLQDVVAMLANGEIHPLPMHIYPAENVSEAFRLMAGAGHVGKIVITHEHDTTSVVEAGTQIERASYLISGGLGALGLITARWLVERQPCDLVLLGRREPDAEARTAIEELEALGARVLTLQADVTDEEAMRRVMTEIRAKAAPLRGVVHAAGVLADSTMQQMDAAGFRRAFAPKAKGTWVLHKVTQDLDLDFFVLYSSVTALLGTPGQANYAAGNAFLDAMAEYRQGQGLPALSINWGPWADVGLAAADRRRGERLAQRGVGSLRPEQGVSALNTLVRAEVSQVAVMPFDLAAWQDAYPAARESRFFDALSSARSEEEATAPAVADIRTQLLNADAGRARKALMASFVRDQVAHVLRLSADRVPMNKPLKALGIDSLMTLELRNRLERSLHVTLSATLIWNYPTVDALTPFLAEKMGISLEMTVEDEPVEAEGDDHVDSSVLDDASRDEIEALLAEELAGIDDLLKNL